MTADLSRRLKQAYERGISRRLGSSQLSTDNGHENVAGEILRVLSEIDFTKRENLVTLSRLLARWMVEMAKHHDDLFPLI